MTLPAIKLEHPATRADLDALPAHLKGEIIDGVLYALPRPRGVHQVLAGRAYADLSNPFERGRGGPGGWWIVPEPGIELPGAPEVAPNIAGWRRERLPRIPRERSITVVPDWVCEVLSSSTRGYHYLRKRPFYARVGVQFLWELDPEARTLVVSQLEKGRWTELGAYSDEEDARLPPFEAAPSPVRSWWLDEASSE